MKSWVEVAHDSHFPIQNLPVGVFSTIELSPRIGVAIGDYVFDIYYLHTIGLLSCLEFDTNIFGNSSLNSFMALDKRHWQSTRKRVTELLDADHPDGMILRDNEVFRREVLVPMSSVLMHMPAQVGDYSDFYSSREHATNVGIMFRGKDNALQPNWLHLPVGYHGRSSSIVVSGTDVIRPCGQVQADRSDPSKGSIFSPCRQLDYELEMAFFVGGTFVNPLGRPMTLSEAEDSIFGVVVMNDWSARDIQAWEYVPLGPFNAKNFCTSISPWVVMLEALAPFKCSSSAIEQVPAPLPYLQDPGYITGSYNINLEVSIGPAGGPLSRVSAANMRCLYWNMKQQLVHHSVTGCPFRPGDLLGTGTISGPTDDSLGSLLELSWRGSRPVALRNSPRSAALDDATATGGGVAAAGVADEDGQAAVQYVTRTFLEDGDTVEMSAFAQGQGYRVGFGAVRGTILPAGSAPRIALPLFSSPAAAAAAAAPLVDVTTASEIISSATTIDDGGMRAAAMGRFSHFKLHSNYRSSSSWRVRIALALKGVPFEYVAVDLSPMFSDVRAKLPAYLSGINPSAQVPVLECVDVHTGEAHQLAQSLPIIEFIDEVTEGGLLTRLLPSDPLLRARVRQMAEIINSGIQPFHNVETLRRVKAVELVQPQAGSSEGGGEGEGGLVTVDSTGYAKFVIEKGFAALESMAVAAHAAPAAKAAQAAGQTLYAAGTTWPTLADTCLVPQVHHAKTRFSVSMSNYPTLEAVAAACELLPPFKQASPECQPDHP